MMKFHVKERRILQVKRVLIITARKGSVRTSTESGYESSTPSSKAVSARRRLALSSLTSTGPRTAEDLQTAIAEARFAELKRGQA